MAPTTPTLGTPGPGPKTPGLQGLLKTVQTAAQGIGKSSPDTVAGSSTSAIYLPPKPTMGNLIQIDSDKFVAWTGGKPNVDWTDLEAGSDTLSPTSPNQRRNHYSPEKSYNIRKAGLKSKFERGDDLLVFEGK